MITCGRFHRWKIPLLSIPRIRLTFVLILIGIGITSLPVSATGSDSKPDPGAVFFAQNCVICHGQGGRGDGILAAALKPADLLADSVQIKSDSILINTIKHGEASMPAFGYQFNDEQLSDLVNHIRGLARQ